MNLNIKAVIMSSFILVSCANVKSISYMNKSFKNDWVMSMISRQDKSVMKILEENPDLLLQVKNGVPEALHLSLSNRSTDLVDLLWSDKCGEKLREDVLNATDANGRTIFHCMAARGGASEFHLIDDYAQSNFNWNIHCEKRSMDGQTPIEVSWLYASDLEFDFFITHVDKEITKKILDDILKEGKLKNIAESWNEEDEFTGNKYFLRRSEGCVSIIERVILFYQGYYVDDIDHFKVIVQKLATHFRGLSKGMGDMFEKHLPTESSDGSAHTDSDGDSVGDKEVKTKDMGTQTSRDVGTQTD